MRATENNQMNACKVCSKPLFRGWLISAMLFSMLNISAMFRLPYYDHELQAVESMENMIASPPSNVKTKPVIAYAISLTSCQTNSTILDGAAILGHSIHLTSKHSNYDYERYAFVHKQDAAFCRPILQRLGWKTIVRDRLPVETDEIQDESLREAVQIKGCCGVKEFMKLYAYTLVDHPIVVHLDTDVVILKPMDELFDTMLLKDHYRLPRYHLMDTHNNSDFDLADFYFVRDYLQGSQFTTDKSQFGVQGGFFVVKPNLTMFDELTSRLMTKETYHRKRGWSNQGHTGYWGASQIQGYLSYVYKHHYPGRAIELNRCIYNSMINDDPYFKKTNTCRTGEASCEDCRNTDFNSLYTIHLTTCRKPWECPLLKEQTHPLLCRQAHKAWFEVRQQLEEKEWGRSVPTTGWHYEWTLGFCQRPKANSTKTNLKPKKKRQYVPIKMPRV